MNIPSEPGRYIAAPRRWGISESGQSKIPTFACEFDLLQFWNGTEWVDVAQDQQEIAGYFYLFKKDGSANQFTIDALRDSLGWNGVSLAALNDNEWNAVEVQLTLDFEEYEGKRRMKVKFINPRDSEPGGVSKADPQQIQSLDSKYGPMLRALDGNGKAPAKPAPKANGQPAKAPAPAGQQAGWKAFLAAWEAYIAERPEEAGDDNRNAKWKEAVGEFFQGEDPKKATPAKWSEFCEWVKTYDLSGIPF